MTSFFEDKRRAYLRCDHCKLVFVPRRYWLRAQDERAIYDLHENTPHDEGYRRFLSRLTTPLLKNLEPNQKGLDFGCGPGPALSVILEEQGHQMDLYDPFYHNDPSVLSNTYDFITATEVVEHMHDPNSEFTTLFNMLRPDGTLGLMTKLVINQNAFKTWHYIHDMTHVCFYSRSTFEYLAQRFNADLLFVANDVILLKKDRRSQYKMDQKHASGGQGLSPWNPGSRILQPSLLCLSHSLTALPVTGSKGLLPSFI